MTWNGSLCVYFYQNTPAAAMEFSEAGLIEVPECLLHACLEGMARSKTEIFLGFGGRKDPRRLGHRLPYSPAEMDTDDACGFENIDDPGS